MAAPTHPDITLVGGTDASLDIDALRPLRLLCWDWTELGGVVFTGHMADEGALCGDGRGEGVRRTQNLDGVQGWAETYLHRQSPGALAPP